MADENQVEEQDTDEGVEVELDAPEQEADVSDDAPAVEASEPTEQQDELDDYGAKVQARIKKLTEKYRKEERDREEAVRMAQQLMQENQKLKSQVKNLDQGYVNSEEARVEAQLEGLKRQYREAYETGDTDAMFAAQQALSAAALQQERLKAAKVRIERQSAEPEGQPAQAAAPQSQAPKPEPKAQEWAEKNEWFGTDEVMTYAAFGIHKKLVEEEGFDPTSDEYYTEVDKRIRSEFPHKFPTAKKSGGAQVAPAAASATRSTAKQGRRSVKLSPSQIAMAKRLNVPLEEYAKYVKD